MHDWAMEHEMDMHSRFFAEALDPAKKKRAKTIKHRTGKALQAEGFHFNVRE